MKYSKGSFITVPSREALAGADPIAQCLYMWLCAFANETGECFPSRATLAAKVGCSEKTVDRYMDLLVSGGFVDKKSRFKNNEQQSNLYTVKIIEVKRGGDTESPPRDTESPGGATKSRTELNPVLTQSNKSKIVILPEYEIEEERPRAKKDVAYKAVFELFSQKPQGWNFHKPQIDAAKRLLTMRGLAQIKKALDFCRENRGEMHFYDVHTPYDLEAKWTKILAYKKKKGL